MGELDEAGTGDEVTVTVDDGADYHVGEILSDGSGGEWQVEDMYTTSDDVGGEADPAAFDPVPAPETAPPVDQADPVDTAPAPAPPADPIDLPVAPDPASTDATPAPAPVASPVDAASAAADPTANPVDASLTAADPTNGPIALAAAADNPNLSPAARAEMAQLANNLETSEAFNTAIWAAPDDVVVEEREDF